MVLGRKRTLTFIATCSGLLAGVMTVGGNQIVLGCDVVGVLLSDAVLQLGVTDTSISKAKHSEVPQ